MKKKGLLKLVIPISLVAVLAVALPLTSGCRPAPPAEVEPVVVGFIGPFASDVGRSTMRGVEIAVDELNEAGGILGGRPVKLVMADSAHDVSEGIKAYEYLNEVEHVDFILSGCIDDVSLGWMPRLAEYKTPTIDTWTSAIRAIELVRDEYDTYKSYFMNIPNDYFIATGMLDFANDVLSVEMDWETMILYQEDTAYGAGVAEFVMAELPGYTGIEILDHVVYDIETVDFSPIYAGMVAKDPDFIYWISSVNSVVPAAQYVELQVPLPLTGICVAAFSLEFWEDTGGMAGGISTLAFTPCLGMEYDTLSQVMIDKYQAKFKTRPIFPHFNAFNGYWGIYQAVNSAEMVYAAGLGSGFEPLDAWVEAMEGEGGDITLYRGDEVWIKYGYYAPGEVDPITGLEMTHNALYDPAGEEGAPMGAIQWYTDGTVKCIYPAKYATGEFELPWWIGE